MLLKNKTAVITGCSKGIGKKILEIFSSNGATIFACTRNVNEEFKNHLEDLKKKFNNEIIPIQFNLNEESEIKKASNEILSSKKNIDILVNNAGIARDNIIMRMKEDDWDSVMNINLKGCFNGIKSVARPMIKNKAGRIINITSVIGQIGNAGQSNYAASKAGIMGLTKSMAKELGSRNITVNAVAPGYITTDMTNELNDEVKEQMKSSIPLGRLGTPDDVANLVCFLASDEAGYITGQTFNVDGGMVMI